VQVLFARGEHLGAKEAVEGFTREKTRVSKGTKEAKWNYKYMKIIEKPVV